MGKAVAHQSSVGGSNARRRAALSLVLTILVFIEREAELLLSLTNMSSKLCVKEGGA
jgi:hypothetical protein